MVVLSVFVCQLALAQQPEPEATVQWTVGFSQDGMVWLYQTVDVAYAGYAEVWFGSCVSFVCGPAFDPANLPSPAKTGTLSRCSAHMTDCCMTGNYCSGSYRDWWGHDHYYSGQCNVGSC